MHYKGKFFFTKKDCEKRKNGLRIRYIILGGTRVQEYKTVTETEKSLKTETVAITGQCRHFGELGTRIFFDLFFLKKMGIS